MSAGTAEPSKIFHNIHYAIKHCSRGTRWIVIAGLLPLATLPAAAQQNRAEPIRIAVAEVRAEEAKGRPLLQRMQQLALQNEAKKLSF